MKVLCILLRYFQDTVSNSIKPCTLCSILSHPDSISTSDSPPSSSGSVTDALISVSLINPSVAHEPRQRRQRIDCAERRLRVWDNRRRPRLKTRLTSTDVANSVSPRSDPTTLDKGLTRNREMIECHSR